MKLNLYFIRNIIIVENDKKIIKKNIHNNKFTYQIHCSNLFILFLIHFYKYNSNSFILF